MAQHRAVQGGLGGPPLYSRRMAIIRLGQIRAARPLGLEEARPERVGWPKLNRSGLLVAELKKIKACNKKSPELLGALILGV
jgi:hypothetical protein